MNKLLQTEAAWDVLYVQGWERVWAGDWLPCGGRFIGRRFSLAEALDLMGQHNDHASETWGPGILMVAPASSSHFGREAPCPT